MSVQGLRAWMHDKVRTIMLALAIVMGIGIALGFGVGGGGGKGGDGQSRATGTIAVVNGEKIDAQALEEGYQERVSAAEKRGQVYGPLDRFGLRGQMFNSLLQQTIAMQAAKHEGISVSKGEIESTVDKEIEGLKTQLVGKGPKDDATVNRALDQMAPGMTIDKLRESMMPQVEAALYIQKLQKKLQDSIDTSDKAIRESYDEAQIATITITTDKRSDAEALKLANDVVKKIRGGADFAAMAKQYSGDPSANTGGVSGDGQPIFISRKSMLKGYQVAFRLKPGEVSDPVKTANGQYVIIKTMATRNTAPKDLADPKKAKTYREQYIAEQSQTVVGGYFDNALKSAKTEIKDGELKAYMTLSKMAFGNPTALKTQMESAISDLKKALENGDGGSDQKARINTQIASLYQQIASPFLGGKPSAADTKKYNDLAIRFYEAATQFDESPQIRMPLAQLYIANGQDAKAAECLDFATQSSYRDENVHKSALSLYKTMKSTPEIQKKIAEETKWLADAEKQKKTDEAAKKSTTSTRP